MRQPRLYLAGPDIFLPDALEIGRRKKALCLEYGFQGLYPLDHPLDPRLTGPELAMAIYAANMGLMDSADGILANLTPFRGPSADAGTVFELGAMLGRGKLALGYSETAATFRERTAYSVSGARQDAASGGWVDGDGVAIEEFGLSDNLMIDCALRAGGFALITPASLDGQTGRFACFEACLQRASRHFQQGAPSRGDLGRR